MSGASPESFIIFGAQFIYLKSPTNPQPFSKTLELNSFPSLTDQLAPPTSLLLPHCFALFANMAMHWHSRASAAHPPLASDRAPCFVSHQCPAPAPCTAPGRPFALLAPMPCHLPSSSLAASRHRFSWFLTSPSPIHLNTECTCPFSPSPSSSLSIPPFPELKLSSESNVTCWPWTPPLPNLLATSTSYNLLLLVFLDLLGFLFLSLTTFFYLCSRNSGNTRFLPCILPAVSANLVSPYPDGPHHVTLYPPRILSSRLILCFIHRSTAPPSSSSLMAETTTADAISSWVSSMSIPFTRSISKPSPSYSHHSLSLSLRSTATTTIPPRHSGSHRRTALAPLRLD